MIRVESQPSLDTEPVRALILDFEALGIISKKVIIYELARLKYL